MPPQPQKTTKKISKKKSSNWKQRLFDKTIGDPVGWLILVSAVYFLFELVRFLLARYQAFSA